MLWEFGTLENGNMLILKNKVPNFCELKSPWEFGSGPGPKILDFLELLGPEKSNPFCKLQLYSIFYIAKFKQFPLGMTKLRK